MKHWSTIDQLQVTRLAYYRSKWVNFCGDGECLRVVVGEGGAWERRKAYMRIKINSEEKARAM